MRPIAIDIARSMVCVSVCWSQRCTVQKRLNRSVAVTVTKIFCAPYRSVSNLSMIEMPFGRLTLVGSRNHLLDWVEIPHWKGQFWRLSLLTCLFNVYSLRLLVVQFEICTKACFD